MANISTAIRRSVCDLQGPGVVAVSGGADSVALLRGLVEVIPGNLLVAHLNHQLRGVQSDADALFVSDLAARLGLPFRGESADLATLAAGGNLEDTARRFRYDWLGQVALEAGASWVATGHTADDQAETVLHRLIRGAGVQGLRGIAPVRPLVAGVMPVYSSRSARGSSEDSSGKAKEPSEDPLAEREEYIVMLVRPLLQVSRVELVEYLRSLGQDWREDASNADTGFTRNRIRHELLPLLRTYNPAIGSVLARTAEQAAELFAEQEALARELLKSAELPRAGAWCVFDAAGLQGVPRMRIRTMFRLVWEREGWPVGSMRFDHWETLADLVHRNSGAADLPDGVRIERTGKVVRGKKKDER